MKVLVIMEHDYDYSYPTGAFVVPDDFNHAEAWKQWQEETFMPHRWKNQYGEGVTRKYANPTFPFATWLERKYERVEVVEI